MEIKLNTLQEENSTLTIRNNELLISLDKANNRIKELENERSSLLTAIRLLQNDSTTSASTTTLPQSQISSTDEIQIVSPKSGTSKPNTSETAQTSKRKNRNSNNTSKSRKDDGNENEVHIPTPTKKSTTVIVGDSMVSQLQGWKMGTKDNRVVIHPFSGSTVDDMRDYIKPILRRKPNSLIIHCGTNSLQTDNPNDIAEKIIDVCQHAANELPDCKIAISELILRADSPKLEAARKSVNKSLRNFCRTRDWDVIPHTVTEAGLNSKGLHLNKSGLSALARDFISYFKSNL